MHMSLEPKQNEDVYKHKARSLSHQQMQPLTFFFHHTTPTLIYTLSLHDALPISCWSDWSSYYHFNYSGYRWRQPEDRKSGSAGMPRPSSYDVFCLKKKRSDPRKRSLAGAWTQTSSCGCGGSSL